LLRSGDLRRTVLRFALPCAYFAWQTGYVLYGFHQLPGELARVTSANPLSNLSKYADYLLGASLPVLALVLSAALLIAYWRPTHRKMIAWAVVSFAGAIVLPLRTATAELFYLLVPMFYLTIALALAIATAAAARSVALRGAVAIVGLSLLTIQVRGYLRHYPLYAARIEMSRNFQAALAAVRAGLGERRPSWSRSGTPPGTIRPTCS
jgi:hypothetical protein